MNDDDLLVFQRWTIDFKVERRDPYQTTTINELTSHMAWTAQARPTTEKP